MQEMIHLGLNTEFSFKQCFGKMDDIVSYGASTGAVGVADLNNTFSHIYLEKQCRAKGIKPIFGVKLMVVQSPEEKVRGRFGAVYTFIAKNQAGLQEIYELTTLSYEKFYYKAMIGIDDMLKVSQNVFVIAENVETTERLDFIALSPRTPKLITNLDIPKLAMSCNRYCTPQDKTVYQLLAGARRAGDGLSFNFNDQTYPQHILTTPEWYRICGDEEAIANTHHLAAECDVEIPVAPMVSYNGTKTLDSVCRKGAIAKGVDLSLDPYKARYEREMTLIKAKDYTDYFLINHDMIIRAKKTMLVGPARGSSAGSLVCWLAGITEVDPIEHKLLFERFIDVNRFDLPDIDIDFPDKKRDRVIKQLIKEYKKENVCHIANINRLKAKSAINEFSMALSIPKYEAEIVKDSLVDRSGGDARAAQQAEDTLKSTEVGREFMERYPAMEAVFKGEGHATHAGKHAAGIIVCNEPINKFGSVNVRDGIIMMDKKGAEAKNLLKIDCLGLRTLSILEDCADLIGMDYKDYYTLPLDDQPAFEIFNQMRVSGIFQFEGNAMQMLCRQMGVQNFNDIVALTALARPGPLHSGAASLYIKRRTGDEPVTYVCDHEGYIKETQDTQGVIVYQEQLMNLCRSCGNMSWEDVSEIRKAASKTMGKEFFDQYRQSFLKGAIEENKIDPKQASEMWENMMTFGSWGMNLSHSVSYGYISYWSAYMKRHHPLEFAAANLNNAKSHEASVRFLRDITENDGIEYLPVDADDSDVFWSIQSGKLVGGLTNIHGIGESKAKEIIRKRKSGIVVTPAMMGKLINPKTPFDTLYPCRDNFGHFYGGDYAQYGLNMPATLIGDVQEAGEYVVVGKVITKDLRDMNEYNELVKRGGRVLEKNNKFLKLIIEDDTGQIFTKISRFMFDKLGGSTFNETLSEGDSWVIIKGKLRDGWRAIEITAIHNLGKIQ